MSPCSASSTQRVPLLHAVLMASTRHPDATRYLPAGVSVRGFAQRTAEKVEALLHGGIEKERLTLVRINALLALHSEGPRGNETASLHLTVKDICSVRLANRASSRTGQFSRTTLK